MVRIFTNRVTITFSSPKASANTHGNVTTPNHASEGKQVPVTGRRALDGNAAAHVSRHFADEDADHAATPEPDERGKAANAHPTAARNLGVRRTGGLIGSCGFTHHAPR